VQMRHTWFLKAYVHKLNVQMYATPKMDNFYRKCIFLGEIVKVGGRNLVQVSKAF
jgi:hypothetical protein